MANPLQHGPATQCALATDRLRTDDGARRLTSAMSGGLRDLRDSLRDVGLREAAIRLRGRVKQTSVRVAGLRGRLVALNPDSVLGRGYSIVRLGTTGELLTDATRARVGEAIRIRLAKGGLCADVTETDT